jgi:hypothetical protein
MSVAMVFSSVPLFCFSLIQRLLVISLLVAMLVCAVRWAIAI